MPTTDPIEKKPPALKGVLGGGLHLTWGFVKHRPWSFALAVGGAILCGIQDWDPSPLMVVT